MIGKRIGMLGTVFQMVNGIVCIDSFIREMIDFYIVEWRQYKISRPSQQGKQKSGQFI